ncbi:MAG TPA: hypothetical protein VGH38_09850 [Bryobacteraceae bacterium]|jgi:hypothetical protein
MTRSLYRSLLWLHPPAFRREFAGEMLWIFDEALVGEGPLRLILDGFFSLLRQWVIGCGAWKIFAAIAGAVLQLLVVSPLGSLVRVPPEAPHHMPLPSNLNYYDFEFSRGLALLVIVLVLATAARSLLARSSDRRRG